MCANTLPIPSTPLVGRDQEVAAAANTLQRADVRLLTLTGPPGIGKTRLALAAVASLHTEFVDGVYFVNLAPVSDANLVLPTIAHAIGHRSASDRPLIQELYAYLANRRVLLVLDNFEQVIEAGPAVAELLQAAQPVKILVTSRELLRIAEEKKSPRLLELVALVSAVEGSHGQSSDFLQHAAALYTKPEDKLRCALYDAELARRRGDSKQSLDLVKRILDQSRLFGSIPAVSAAVAMQQEMSPKLPPPTTSPPANTPARGG